MKNFACVYSTVKRLLAYFFARTFTPFKSIGRAKYLQRYEKKCAQQCDVWRARALSRPYLNSPFHGRLQLYIILEGDSSSSIAAVVSCDHPCAQKNDDENTHQSVCHPVPSVGWALRIQEQLSITVYARYLHFEGLVPSQPEIISLCGMRWFVRSGATVYSRILSSFVST